MGRRNASLPYFFPPDWSPSSETTAAELDLEELSIQLEEERRRMEEKASTLAPSSAVAEEEKPRKPPAGKGARKKSSHFFPETGGLGEEGEEVLPPLSRPTVPEDSAPTPFTTSGAPQHGAVNEEGSGGSIPSSPSRKVNLLSLTGETVYSVFGMLNSPELISVGTACSELHAHESDIKDGKAALQLAITPDEKRSHGIRLGLVKMDKGKEVLCRTPRPGFAVVIFNEPVSVHTCYWEITLERFCGPRMLIGVAARDGLAKPSVLKKQFTWVFDCNGKFQHADEWVHYGNRCKSGDVVGVLLNNGDHSLTFFLNGKCLGVAGYAKPAEGQLLYPIVSLSSLVGDSAVLSRPITNPLAPRNSRVQASKSGMHFDSSSSEDFSLMESTGMLHIIEEEETMAPMA